MSYLVEPMNTDVLAQILMQIDPAQTDAVTLMHGIANSQTALAAATVGILSRELDTHRDINVLLNIAASNAAQHITKSHAEIKEQIR